ncbi:MAG: aldo/keto reductase, partial [Acidimicrobiales bacterium]|nr:aldo/keto reductase [Acidimicrobiales bacterium]
MQEPAITSDERVRVLADGTRMPLLGLGVWQVPEGSETENAVR